MHQSTVPLRSIDIVQPLVKEILEKAREIYPDAYIAGGYLRDRVTGTEPKDLDLFTHMPIPDNRQQYVTHFDSADFGLVEKRLTGVESFGEVDFTTESVMGYHYPVQIIHIDPLYSRTPWDTITKFLFGAQQAFWRPDQVFGKTDAFLDDLMGKHFTVTRCEHELDIGSVNLKWNGTDSKQGYKDRFPGWKLRVPTKWWHAHGGFDQFFGLGDVAQEGDYMVVEAN